MKVRKRGKDSGGSGSAKNKLFGAIGHVHNPFSANSRRAHGVEAYRKDENVGELRAVDFEAEMKKIEASAIAQNLVARFQKS
ncbi:MAG TPA: hypothetical protein VJ249_05570 [Candidatus Bathyarchaeia archaeon]|nr:hypothetical protein [Candidatus Bathyarchaeia archaeon]